MRTLTWTMLAVMGLGLLAAPAFAQDHPASATPAATAAPAENGFRLLSDPGAGAIGAGIGAGLVIIGAASGIGRIGGSAAESMARQPEAAGQINTIALITAAMLEGATLFAVVVCMMAL